MSNTVTVAAKFCDPKNGVILFTAAQIAKATAWKPQFVRKKLKGIGTDGTCIVNGTIAAGFRFSSLPSPVIARLAKLAPQFGFSTPLQLLENPPRRSASVSLAHVANGELEHAQKLMRVLAPVLRDDRTSNHAELARRAAPEYARELGQAVSERHLRDLIKRTQLRDSGLYKFDRLQLYLREKPARIRRRTRIDAALNFDELDAALSTVRDRNRPTISEIAYCWRETVEMIVARVGAAGANEVKLKQQLRRYIVRNAPFLGATDIAVKRSLNRKLREAAMGGGLGALIDGRLHPAKRRTDRDLSRFDPDIAMLAEHTVKYCEKRESQAYRQLHVGNTHNSDRFSEEFRQAFPFNPRKRKSEVPRCIRNAIRSKVNAAWPRHLGQRATQRTRPRGRRDWSGVFAGDYFVGDDATGDHHVHEFRDDGEYECDRGRFNFGRPQWLPVYDELTTLPLGFVLRLCAQPTADMICLGLSRVFLSDRVGMPHVGLTLEMGRYAAHAVTGLISFADLDEAFLRQGLNLTIHRAHSPEAKSRAEGPIGRMQQMFAYGLGYVGHNERSVQYERAQRFKASLKRVGQPSKPAVDPGEGSMSLEEYAAELECVAERYANEAQNGEILRDARGLGLSPVEGWNRFRSGKPHRALPPELMFLLTSRGYRCAVTSDGISIVLNGVEHIYQNSEKLGSYLGERMAVRLNPEMSDYIAVSHLATDPNGRSAFRVPLEKRLPAKAATRHDFDARRASQAAFTTFGKTVCREFSFANTTTISDSKWGTPELRAGGRRHLQLEQEHTDLQYRRDAVRRDVNALARKHGLAIDVNTLDDPEESLRLLLEAEEWDAKNALETQRARHD